VIIIFLKREDDKVL